MKFAIIFTCLLLGTTLGGEFESKCKGNAACEEVFLTFI